MPFRRSGVLDRARVVVSEHTHSALEAAQSAAQHDAIVAMQEHIGYGNILVMATY